MYNMIQILNLFYASLQLFLFTRLCSTILLNNGHLIKNLGKIQFVLHQHDAAILWLALNISPLSFMLCTESVISD